MMDPIKEAFKKVREDIDFLFTELQSIKASLEILKKTTENVSTLSQPLTTINRTSKELQHIHPFQQTNQHIFPTHTSVPTHIPTHIQALEGSERQNTKSSIGNEGVPTNQQTNQQTNQHPNPSTGNAQIRPSEDKISHLRRVNEVISSLDSLKKEVRIKFKQLTDQEMAIYAAIYQLEEQGLLVDYSLLSEKFALSEISIRDYIRKIMKKGVEITKNKQHNKKVVLSIPQGIRHIASLSTIIQLREL